MMSKRIHIGSLQVASELQQLLEADILPGTVVTAESFWQGLETILTGGLPLGSRKRMRWCWVVNSTTRPTGFSTS